MNKLKTVNIHQIVKARKHDVDIESLRTVLRMNKKITNREISVALNVPITKVEHWFRNDSCFSIPDENIWYQLKRLLNIETDEFDNQITEFEYKFGSYEKVKDAI